MQQSPLYVGIDIGKTSHHATLISLELLTKYKRYTKCPSFRVENSRTGFEHLLKQIRLHTNPEHCHVLFESTGHYGAAFEQYLREHQVTLYRINPQERYSKDKTDKRDAQALALMLYNQQALGAVVSDKSKEIRPFVAPSKTAIILHGLVQHRTELVRETTRRKNKLIAIADELFPELVRAYSDTANDSALNLREKYPTPEDVANASLDDLKATRAWTRPSNKLLMELQELATQTIGTKNEHRRKTLLLEQSQLISEYRLLTSHVAVLDAEIESAIADSREGKILTSFIGISTTSAAILIAGTGSIANFDSVAKYRAYLGWSPRQSQTGTSYDESSLNRARNGNLQRTIFLTVLSAIENDPRWKAKYERLVPLKCQWNERKQEWQGRIKVIGRIAGDMIRVIYTLLKKDYDLLAGLAPDSKPPDPELYDTERWKKAREGNHVTPPSN